MNTQEKPNFFSIIAVMGLIGLMFFIIPISIMLAANDHPIAYIIICTFWNFGYLTGVITAPIKSGTLSFLLNTPIWLLQQIAMVISLAMVIHLTLFWMIGLCLFFIAALAILQILAWKAQRSELNKLINWFLGKFSPKPKVLKK